MKTWETTEESIKRHYVPGIFNEVPPTANETTNYTYDDENRLTKVVITKNAKQKELTFTYDPFGRRITKTLTKDEIGTDCNSPNVCPRTTTYVYDNQSIIAEYDTNGEVQNRYTHGPNIDEPLAIEVKAGATYTPYYYHADGLGSITSISNAGGAIVQRYAYDSFGNMTITTNGNINQPYTYTSREYDTETGMYFYRARYYDPKAGRFVTKDPIGFAGGDVNLYNYVGGDPVNYVDPWGLAGCTGGQVAKCIVACKLIGKVLKDCTPSGQRDFGICVVPIFTCRCTDKPSTDPPKCPKNPSESPGPDWEWRGPKDKGSWYNEKLDQSLRHDPKGPNNPHGEHYDWKVSKDEQWRLYPDGRTEPK